MCLFSINLTIWGKSYFFFIESRQWLSLEKRCLIPWQITSSNNNQMVFFSWEITSVHFALSVPLWSVYLCSQTNICCLWKLSVCHDPRRNHLQFLQPTIYTHLGPWTTISISIVVAKHFVCYYLKKLRMDYCTNLYIQICMWFLWHRMFSASLTLTHMGQDSWFIFHSLSDGHLLESWLWQTAAMLMYYQGSLFLDLLWVTDDPFHEQDRWVW